MRLLEDKKAWRLVEDRPAKTASPVPAEAAMRQAWA